MNNVENRMEILFLYEAKDCNPNGDPLDENKPRIDPETEIALVTDVRIKRTIRDYIYYVKGKDILVRDTYDKDGYLNDAKGRANDLAKEAKLTPEDSIPEATKKLKEYISKSFVDARLFGTALPFTPPKKEKKKAQKEKKEKEASVQITGPVQFSGFGRSLHRVSPMLIQGTAAFASKKGDIQKSFREDYIVPYACIATYGIINEVAAKTTNLSEEDVKLLFEALWNGTTMLHSRSKIGHRSLFLLVVKHEKGVMTQIGDMREKIKLVSELDDLEIRNIKDYQIVIDDLVDSLNSRKEHIDSLLIRQNENLTFSYNGEAGMFKDIIRDTLPISTLSWDEL